MWDAREIEREIKSGGVGGRQREGGRKSLAMSKASWSRDLGERVFRHGLPFDMAFDMARLVCHVTCLELIDRRLF